MLLSAFEPVRQGVAILSLESMSVVSVTKVTDAHLLVRLVTAVIRYLGVSVGRQCLTYLVLHNPTLDTHDHLVEAVFFAVLRLYPSWTGGNAVTSCVCAIGYVTRSL